MALEPSHCPAAPARVNVQATVLRRPYPLVAIARLALGLRCRRAPGWKPRTAARARARPGGCARPRAGPRWRPPAPRREVARKPPRREPPEPPGAPRSTSSRGDARGAGAAAAPSSSETGSTRPRLRRGAALRAGARLRPVLLGRDDARRRAVAVVPPLAQRAPRRARPHARTRRTSARTSAAGPEPRARSAPPRRGGADARHDRGALPRRGREGRHDRERRRGAAGPAVGGAHRARRHRRRGCSCSLPPGAFTRARLRWAIPVGGLFLTRVATSGFWRTDTRLGTSVDASLERGIKRAALLRLSGQAQLTEESRGVEWSTELAAFRAFTRAVAGSVGFGMLGASDAQPAVERYGSHTRLRSDVYRRWLFLELEPEVYWPWIRTAAARRRTPSTSGSRCSSGAGTQSGPIGRERPEPRREEPTLPRAGGPRPAAARRRTQTTRRADLEGRLRDAGSPSGAPAAPAGRERSSGPPCGGGGRRRYDLPVRRSSRLVLLARPLLGACAGGARPFRCPARGGAGVARARERSLRRPHRPRRAEAAALVGRLERMRAAVAAALFAGAPARPGASR